MATYVARISKRRKKSNNILEEVAEAVEATLEEKNIEDNEDSFENGGLSSITIEKIPSKTRASAKAKTKLNPIKELKKKTTSKKKQPAPKNDKTASQDDIKDIIAKSANLNADDVQNTLEKDKIEKSLEEKAEKIAQEQGEPQVVFSDEKTFDQYKARQPLEQTVSISSDTKKRISSDYKIRTLTKKNAILNSKNPLVDSPYHYTTKVNNAIKSSTYLDFFDVHLGVPQLISKNPAKSVRLMNQKDFFYSLNKKEREKAIENYPEILFNEHLENSVGKRIYLKEVNGNTLFIDHTTTHQSNDYKLLCLFPNNNIANNKKSDVSKDIHIFTDGSLFTYRLEANKNKEISGFSQQNIGVDYTKKAGIGYFIQNCHQFTFGKGYISPYDIEFNIKKDIEEHLDQLADNDDSVNDVAIPYRGWYKRKVMAEQIKNTPIKLANKTIIDSSLIELAAIEQALKEYITFHKDETKHQNVYLHSDNLNNLRNIVAFIENDEAKIQTFANSSNGQVFKRVSEVAKIIEDNKINIIWVRGHNNIKQNEITDQLAKDGAEHLFTTYKNFNTKNNFSFNTSKTYNAKDIDVSSNDAVINITDFDIKNFSSDKMACTMNLTISRGKQIYINTVTFNYPNQLDYSRVKQMMLKGINYLMECSIHSFMLEKGNKNVNHFDLKFNDVFKGHYSSSLKNAVLERYLNDKENYSIHNTLKRCNIDIPDLKDASFNVVINETSKYQMNGYNWNKVSDKSIADLTKHNEILTEELKNFHATISTPIF